MRGREGSGKQRRLVPSRCTDDYSSIGNAIGTLQSYPNGREKLNRIRYTRRNKRAVRPCHSAKWPTVTEKPWAQNIQSVAIVRLNCYCCIRCNRQTRQAKKKLKTNAAVATSLFRACFAADKNEKTSSANWAATWDAHLITPNDMHVNNDQGVVNFFIGKFHVFFSFYL